MWLMKPRGDDGLEAEAGLLGGRAAERTTGCELELEGQWQSSAASGVVDEMNSRREAAVDGSGLGMEGWWMWW